MSVDDLAKLYRDVMTELLDCHCPVVTVRRRVRPMTPWFDADCRAARRRRGDTDDCDDDVLMSTSRTGRHS